MLLYHTFPSFADAILQEPKIAHKTSREGLGSMRRGGRGGEGRGGGGGGGECTERIWGEENLSAILFRPPKKKPSPFFFNHTT